MSRLNFGFCSVLVSSILPLPPVMVPSVAVAGVVVAPFSLFVSLFAVASAVAVTTYVLPPIVMGSFGFTAVKLPSFTVPSTMRYT